MKNYFNQIFVIFWKDALLEFRTKEIFTSVLVFSLLIVLTFSLGLDNIPITIPTVASGILWIAIIFGGVIAMNRTYATEVETGVINRILLSSISRDAFFFGKALSNIALMIFLEIVLVPTIIVLYDLDIPLIDLILLSMLVILAISLIGTLFSAIAIKTKTKEVMLPILMLPILTPVLIAAVETTSALIVGQTISDTQKWVSLIVVFDAIFLVLSPFLFTLIVSE
ncbi:MAG: heme ABC transporter permease CcmB [Chloroflexi bacterium]|nr:heme ABC transporter permease CcmB [Chloroflexota bacterium]